MRQFILKYRYTLLLSFLFIFLRLPSLFEPYWYGDEGIYLVLGQGIRKGLTLYSEIHDNKPPLLYYFAALSQTVFGFRLMLAAFMALTNYVFYLFSKKLFTQQISRLATLIFLVLTSIPFLEGHIANAEVFMLLPTLYAVYLIFPHQPKLLQIASSALLLGLAFTIKIPVAFEFAAFALYLLLASLDFKIDKKILPRFLQKLPPLLIFATFFLLPIFLWSIYFYFKSAFPEFIFASLLQNFGYLSSWQTGSHSGSASQSGVMTRAILLFISWAIIIFFRFLKKIDNKFTFLLLWFTSTIFASLLSTRPYPHYLIQILPPTILLFAYLISKKVALFSRLAIILLFLFSFLVYKKYKFYSYPTISYYKNYYSYLLDRKDLSSYRRYFNSSIDSLYLAADYIKQNSSPDDHIFIWGDEAYLYALSDRLPVGRYTVAYHILDFNGYEETINQLKTQLPPFIVYLPMSNRPFPELDDIISLYYYPDKQFSPFTIFRLR